MWQLFRGLAHIHACGVIHRDIKVQNILVGSDGTLVICDFGSAKLVDADNKDDQTTYICSRWYRAPELILGNKKYDLAVDIWGAGCCFAELLRYEPLFKGLSS